ncbi:hypothetical protein C2R22_05655 [Salinigranum rubrum]|uniref:Uncharacterized protein n=1 Tax=Salinigranum rubrum TaxID=755307 RepID=A0A2I8VH07_9EURY|nr:hypothetical protein C2R22_05655 [Salinigranum rubrum]
MSRQVIELDDEVDRWKWVCPKGHRSWEPTNHHFWCAKCASHYEADGVFHQLRNLATGDLYERDEVELQTPAGPYSDRFGQEGSA